jgi:protein-S-isoprenylcysteine O-methyltransferase Ste14
VVAMLAGEAMFFASTRVALWLLVVLAVNHAYFLLLEEPGLEHRFGDDYRRYREAVPRWLPRRQGWS